MVSGCVVNSIRTGRFSSQVNLASTALVVRAKTAGSRWGVNTLQTQSRNLDARGHGAMKANTRIAAEASVGGESDVKGDMLEPSVANKPLVRFAALAAVVATAARSTGFLPSAGIGFVHMLAFGTWFGTLAWTSFIFGIVAFRNLPRQTFGKLQSKLFPKYFALSSSAPAILLATLYYATNGNPPINEVRLLVISLVCSLTNLLFTEPAATKVMFQRYEMENSSGPRDEGMCDSPGRNLL